MILIKDFEILIRINSFCRPEPINIGRVGLIVVGPA